MSLAERVRSVLNEYPDFPKPGILFFDIMPVLRDPVLLDELCGHIAHLTTHSTEPVTAVAALDSRGYLFGPEVARRLRVPFVQISKPGKIKSPHATQTYEKEYGSDSLCVAKGLLPVGANVLLIDDLLATGGTMSAACGLVESVGARVAAVFCVIELQALAGRDTLPEPAPPVHTLLAL